MKIFVKYNDITRAYKVLMKKINDEGTFKTLKSKEFYLSKSQKERAKKKIALSRFRKEEKKRRLVEAKQEEKFLLYSKKSGNVQTHKKRY